jgi:hypothetical protein
MDDVRSYGAHKYLVLGATQGKSNNMFVHCFVIYVMHLWKQRTHIVVLLWNVLQSYHDLKRDVLDRKEVYTTTEVIVQFMCESTFVFAQQSISL